jgi:3-oxoacyl-[acyl-carrier-protein] synthase-3
MRIELPRGSVTGIVTVVPKNSLLFEDEISNFDFPSERTRKLGEVMGYKTHRVVEDGVTATDLASFGIQYLISRGLLQIQEVSAIVFVSQSPDHLIPANSHVIHGLFGFSEDVYCIDIIQGCAGYVVGLMESFGRVSGTKGKILLINADVLSQKVSKSDRNSWPLIGDAASISVIQEQEHSLPSKAIIKFSGQLRDALLIPAGGFRLPNSESTSRMIDDGTGNKRSQENLVMDGTAVFNFVQEKVPQLILDLLDYCEIELKDLDYFVFHQPNRFMLEKLEQKIKIPPHRLLKNIVENFGNSSGVSIPTAITFNLGSQLLNEKLELCLAGFGVGLTWGAIKLTLGPLDFCEIIEY